MSRLEKHAALKRRLLSWYDSLLSDHAELLLLDGGNPAFSEESLRDAQSNLAADRYIVAVCGQMKAGKSTLLNALLFRREVLPAAATTMTAKIALIDGAERDHIAAHLYTPKAFDAVVAAASADEKARKELAEARDKSRKAGILEREVLTDPARVEEREGLDALAEFCAVPTKGGIFMPYVRQVHVWAESEWLQQVTVADTPGTNDPNPERDKITKEWISRADAVVYVTYAGQAGLDATDLDFIDRYLRHINPMKRIIAVNKCDTQPDLDGIRRHFRNRGACGDLRMQELFGDVDDIVLVSGQAALIERMRTEGHALSHQLEAEAEMLEIEGWLDPDRHGLPLLQAEIERRILSSRGEAVVSAHIERIEAIFTNASRAMESERVSAIEGLSACSASTGEREEEMQRTQEAIAEVKEATAMVQDGIRKHIREAEVQAAAELVPTTKKIAQDVEARLSSVRNVKNLASHAAWSVPRAFSTHRAQLRRPIQDLVEASERALNASEKDLSQRLLKGGMEEYKPREHLLPVNAHALMRSIEERADQAIDRELIQKLVDKADTFFRRLFKKAASDAVEKLLPELERIVHSAMNDLLEEAERRVAMSAESAVSDMEGSINTILQKRYDQLQELQQEEADDAAKAAELSEYIREQERQLNEVAALNQQFLEEIRL